MEEAKVKRCLYPSLRFKMCICLMLNLKGEGCHAILHLLGNRMCSCACLVLGRVEGTRKQHGFEPFRVSQQPGQSKTARTSKPGRVRYNGTPGPHHQQPR